MHVIINQNPAFTESVNLSVITKLYDILNANLFDLTSNLRGTLEANIASRKQIDALEAAFPELAITARVYSLAFNDPNVELAVLASFGADYITEADAAGFNIPQDWLSGNTSIQNFEEFKYFTTSNYNKRIFSGCTNLQRITINRNMGEESFYGCDSLNEVSFMSGCTRLEDKCFYRCPALVNVDFNNLSITIPNDKNIFGASSGNNVNSSLKNVAGGSNLVYGPRYGCVNALEKIDNVFYCSLATQCIFTSGTVSPIYQAIFFPNATNVKRFAQHHGNIFLYCPAVSTTVITDASTTNTYFGQYKYWRYGNAPYLTYPVIYFKNLSSVGPYTFCSAAIQNIIINNSTPPTFTNLTTATGDQNSDGLTNIFSGALTLSNSPVTSNSINIYVPDAAVNTYQADLYWGNQNIYPISDLVQYATNAAWEDAGKPVNAIITEYM